MNPGEPNYSKILVGEAGAIRISFLFPPPPVGAALLALIKNVGDFKSIEPLGQVNDEGEEVRETQQGDVCWTI